MMITARDGRIAYANAQAERLFRADPGSLLGCSVEDLIPERFRGRHPVHRATYFREPRTRAMGAAGLELVGLRRDGTEFPAEISLAPLVTDHGIWAMTAIRDVTDRKVAERERIRLEKAQEAVRARDEFLAIAAHELRTPLTALQLQLQGLERQVSVGDAQPSVRTKVGRTVRYTARLTRLVDLLLDVSRIVRGKLALHLEELDLGGLVQEVIGDLADQAKLAGCDVSLDCPRRVTGIWDRFRVEQILVNLVTNAFRYAAHHPVRVALDEVHGSARLIVEDHGGGVLPDDVERIFERFERAVSRNFTGMGLGLYIARHIAEAHGGSIHVVTAPGEGATFRVLLPLHPQA